MNSMFEDAGEKIQLIAKILFWVSVVACVICAFKFGLYTYYTNYGYDKHTGMKVGVFWGFLIIGPVISYMSSLVTIAFGQLVENSQRIADQTYTMSKNSTEDSDSESESSTIFRPLFAENKPITGTWKCQFCGKENPNYSNGCTCGHTKTESTNNSQE